MLKNLRENEYGIIFRADFVPGSLFNFYIDRRRVFADGTANWNICCELANDPNKYMVIDTIRGTKADAVFELEKILKPDTIVRL